MTFDGLDLAALTLTILAVYALVHYVEWRQADRYRRLERRSHVNLLRQTGGRA